LLASVYCGEAEDQKVVVRERLVKNKSKAPRMVCRSSFLI